MLLSMDLSWDNINLIDLGIYDDEHVTITIQLKNDTQSLQMPIFYTLNYSNLEQDINQLKTNHLRLMTIRIRMYLVRLPYKMIKKCFF